MVVHNSKWDRKAKQKYLKKHNLTAADVAHKNEEPAPEVEPEELPQEPEPELEQLEEGEQVELFQRPYLPELAPENADETRIIREAASKASVKPTTKNNVRVVSEEEFAKASADVERSNMNHRVRTRLGKKLATLDAAHAPEIDDDFDEFMRTTSAPKPSQTQRQSQPIITKEIENDKQSFIDSLL